jgi:hypothetical protein
MRTDLIYFPHVYQTLQPKTRFLAGRRNVPIDVLRGTSMLYIVRFLTSP